MKKILSLMIATFITAAPLALADDATKKAAEDAGQKIQGHAKKAGEGLQHAADSTTAPKTKSERRPFLRWEDLHKDRSMQGAGESPSKNTKKTGKKEVSIMDERHITGG